MANEELTLQDKDIFLDGKGQGSNNKLASAAKESARQEQNQSEVMTPVVETGRDTADLLAKSEAQKLRKATNSQNKSGTFSNENLDLKKQAQSTNMNLLSYQTANFGAAGDQATKRGQAKEGIERNESHLEGEGEHTVIRNES